MTKLDKLTYFDDGKVTTLQGRIFGEDAHFVTILVFIDDGVHYRVNKNRIIVIEEAYDFGAERSWEFEQEIRAEEAGRVK